MGKFTRGDRVRCINTENVWKLDGRTLYTVNKSTEEFGQEMISLRELESPNGYFAYRFKLVRHAKPKKARRTR